MALKYFFLSIHMYNINKYNNRTYSLENILQIIFTY